MANSRASRVLRGALALTLAGAVALVATAPAASKDPLLRSKYLWATVNACDTVAYPDSVGIRGSMPGSGNKREQMFMRILLQYKRPSDGTWRGIGTGADSGWIGVGSGRYKARQTGRYFTVTPSAAMSYLLRGSVTYEWRVDGEVVRRARRYTQAGHKKTPGADPPNHSTSTCTIKK